MAVSVLSAMNATPSFASSPWTVTRLHPNDSLTQSALLGGFGGQQVGYVVGVGQEAHASYWSGSAGSWIDLNPSGASRSYALKASGSHQVGYARMGPTSHAGYWSGTAESWVDLNPAGAIGSAAFGITGGHQVGLAAIAGQERASRWSGSAETWIDLHPATANTSVAYDEFNGQQVGHATFVTPGFPFSTSSFHASIWYGTSASWIDLNPTGATSSIGYGIHSGKQVGWAEISNQRHASLWAGTAASWIDLHPNGFSSSVAYSILEDMQVGGVADAGGLSRASLWRGTAGSWEDLSAALTGEWCDTAASSIWRDGDTLYVGGGGLNLLTGNEEALLWSRPVPEPNSFLIFLMAGGAPLAIRPRGWRALVDD